MLPIVTEVNGQYVYGNFCGLDIFFNNTEVTNNTRRQYHKQNF